MQVIDEFGSFDKYIWSFVNHKPIVGQFRYPRQVPVKSPKSEVISKDLIRRGFRSVGPTVGWNQGEKLTMMKQLMELEKLRRRLPWDNLPGLGVSKYIVFHLGEAAESLETGKSWQCNLAWDM
ncbi:hypothetical protein Golax_007664, partial [Gossypium laxum]|nr:hypothetical protein [Gossypium laxum]